MRSASIKQKAVFAPIKGLRTNLAGTIIDDLEMTDCSSVLIDHFTSTIRKKDGYILKGLNLPLSGPIEGIDQYFLSSGVSKLMVASTKDWYYLNVSDNKYKYVTRGYSTGTCSVPELTTNGGFETWTGLTDISTDGGMEVWSSPTVLTNWILLGEGTPALNREATTIHGGAYSAKISGGTNYTRIYQTLITVIGKTYVLGVWVWCATGNKANVTFSDGISGQLSSYHTGSSSWEYLSCVYTAQAITCQIYCSQLNGTTAYFDGAIFYEQLAPTGWLFSGANATVAREEGIVKVGTYSAKLTRSGVDCFIAQLLSADGIAYRGKTVTFGGWVYATVANRTFLNLNDGIRNYSSAFHTGDSTWQYLKVTATIDVAATALYAYCYIANGDTSAYFDSASCFDAHALTGSSTAWLTSGIVAGDKIGLGSTNPDTITTWYTVASVDSDTHITITDTLTAITGALPYNARILYTGDKTFPWNTEIMNDLFIATNDIDVIQKYTNTGLMLPLGGTPPKAKFVKKYKDYLVLGFVTSGGTTYPQRIQWCDTGAPESWTVGVTNAGFTDLSEGVDWVQGMDILQDRLIVFKERSIYSGYLVDTAQIFQFDIKITGIGVASPLSIQALGDETIFLGFDGVYTFNGFNVEDISDPIRETLINALSPGLAELAHALLIEELDEYHLFIPTGNSLYPNYEFVYNYVKKCWTKAPANNITRTGFYQKQATVTWDTAAGTWDQLSARWDDRSFLSNAPTNLYGDSSGNVFEKDYTISDENGVAVDGYFDTKDFVMEAWDSQKFWNKIEFVALGNSVDVYYSIDEGKTWTFLQKKTLDENAWTTYKIDFKRSSDKIRFRFRNPRISETFYIRQYLIYFGMAGRLPI